MGVGAGRGALRSLISAIGAYGESLASKGHLCNYVLVVANIKGVHLTVKNKQTKTATKNKTKTGPSLSLGTFDAALSRWKQGEKRLITIKWTLLQLCGHDYIYVLFHVSV